MGSYALSGFDNINLYNGNLNFSLPLLNIGGRGTAQTQMRLTINPKWLVDGYQDQAGYTVNYATLDWWSPSPGYGPGRMVERAGGEYNSSPCYSCSSSDYCKTVTRLTFITPDGTEHEFRDQNTGGQLLAQTCPGTLYSRQGILFRRRTSRHIHL
jgi:hypothetical protein